MQNMPSHDELDASYQALRNIITHPEFQKVLTEIQNVPPSERLQALSTHLAPKALAAKGIQIPEGSNITMHISHDLPDLNSNNTDRRERAKFCFTFPGGISICTSIITRNSDLT